MKKIILSLFLIGTMTTMAMSQYKPYASLGAGVYNGVMSYGAETGLYNTHNWFAVGINFANEAKWEHYAQIKYYRKLFSNPLFTDYYLYTGLNMKLDGTRDLSFEPGGVAVFNISKKWAPQVSATIPIYKGTNLAASFSLGINYWIK